MPAKSRISCIFTVHLQLHPGRAGQTPEGGIRPVYVELAEWSIVMDSGDTSFRRSDFAPSTMIAGSIEQLATERPELACLDEIALDMASAAALSARARGKRTAYIGPKLLVENRRSQLRARKLHRFVRPPGNHFRESVAETNH